MTAEVIMIKRKTTRKESDILKEIRRNATRKKEVVQALKKEDGLTWEEDRVVYMEEKIYVPNNKKIKEEILKKNHDLVDVGHPGQHRMLELLKKTYWWLGLKEDIKRYVQKGSTPKEGRKTTPIENTSRTMARNQMTSRSYIEYLGGF